MALEVGRLVARIDIEGSFEQKLTAAKTAMEDAAKSAGRFDDAMNKAGQSGAKLKVSDEPKRKIDDAAKSATKLDDGLSKASEAGKRLDVSNDARRKLDDTATSAGKTATSLDKASESGKNMQVSDQPRQKLAETASVADQVNTKFSGLGVTMKQVVGMAGGAAGLGAVLTKGWDRITAIDTAQGKLRGLGHEAAGVETIMTSALDSVTGTAYGLGDAATIAANATAAGIAPGKELTKYLTMTADASAIAGVSLGEMGRILNQVQTGQSAYAGDLSQLADRGIPIYQWLADEAGVAAEEIKGMASTGQVSSQMLFSAIQNNIGGAAQEMGGTLVGSLANVGAAFGRLGASAIDPFKDDIMGAAEGAQEFAGAMSGVVGPAASVAASALSGVAKVVGTIPTPILAATAGLVALQKTGLGASMAGAASTAMGSLRSVGETIALGGMYAKDGVKANGLFAASMDGIRGAAGGMRRGLSSIVDMLGGPLMVGLAGATIAVTDIVGSIQRASTAQGEISESAARAASAHRDLALAVGEANGAMSDQAVAAAQSIIEESITSTGAAAEQASGMFAGLGNWIDQTTLGYDGMKNAIDGNVSAMDRSRLEGRVNEMQMAALAQAAGDLGIEMDEVSAIAQRGGPRWNELKDAIASVGPEGVDMADKLQAAADAARATADAAREAEDGSYQLAEAFRVLGDEASTAEDRTSAMKAALDALAGEQMSADEAMGRHHETIRRVNEAYADLAVEGENLTRTLEDGKLGFDTSTESGFEAWQMMLKLRDSHTAAVNSGRDLNEVQEETDVAMKAAADSIGVTVDQLWEMVESIGFVPSKINTMVELSGAGEVLADIGRVATELEGVPPGKEITVKAASQEAIDYLRSVGWEVDHIPGEKNMRITASTEEARAGLAEATAAANRLDNIAPDVHVETNAEWVTHALGVTAEATEGLPPGHIEITDTTPENMQRLADLGIKVNEPKNGVVTINDEDVTRARGEVNSLSLIQTESQHRVNVTYSNPDFRGSGGSSSYADGGFHRRQVQSFADGGHRLGDVAGFLPNQAMIAAPQGPGGLVQWAENETQGEAFIPLARSKRRRSSKILSRVADMFGYTMLTGAGEVASFANGGVVEGMTALVGKKFPALKATSTYRNSNDHHGGGKAVDFSNGYDNTPEQLALANYIADNFPDSLELIYSHPGFNRNIKNGKFVGDGVGFYGAGTMAGHRNHVHWAMSTPPSEAAEKTKVGTLGGAAVDNRTPRQKNIDAIVAEGQRRGLSDRDIQIALMTAEQESGIRVLANPSDPASMSMAHEGVGYDHDSTGIFQQRNNGAWGTLEDRMDPTKSAGMFYDELEKIDGRDQMALTAVAQKVQRSAYPDAYAKHEGKASEELAASKARLESLSRSSGGSGEGQKVFVTNWPSGSGSYTRSSASSDAIDEAKDAVEDAQKAAFIQDQSIAALAASALGRSDLIQVEAFANGGFHGLENHSAHIAPAGSWRVFGEPETGGEAYIPLASHKRARSTAILAETARRMGYSLGAGVNLVGSVLTGNGLDTGWGGPSLSDLGIDTGALNDALSPGVQAEASRAGQQIAAILQELGQSVDQQVEGTLRQANDGANHLRQQYARAMI